MNVQKTKEDSKLTVVVEGRLDTLTSPQLEKELENSLSGITEIVFDFEKLEYISSAGLRVLLSARKALNNQNLYVKNVGKAVKDVFDITGFWSFLTIK